MTLKEIVKEELLESDSTPSPDAAVEVTGKLRCGSFDMGIRIYMRQSPHPLWCPERVNPSDIHPNATRRIVRGTWNYLDGDAMLGRHSPESRPVPCLVFLLASKMSQAELAGLQTNSGLATFSTVNSVVRRSRQTRYYPSGQFPSCQGGRHRLSDKVSIPSPAVLETEWLAEYGHL